MKASIYKIFSYLPYSVINLFRDVTIKAFKYVNTRYVYKIVHPNNGVYPIARSTFEDLCEHEFEGRMFYIPKNYDEFLRQRYGDYMQLPPEASVYDCCSSIVECKL